MSKAIETLQLAMQNAMKIRPKAGGFPVLAEVLRQAGINKNSWALPSCQATYVTSDAVIVSQMAPLTAGFAEVPRFDRDALIRALRADQEGRSVFPEFLARAWEAGVVRYDVDFEKRRVTYFGARGESYLEEYPAVTIPS